MLLRRSTSGSKSAPILFVRAGLAFLAILIVISPSFASNSQPATVKQESPSAVCPAGGQCFADVLPGTPFYEFINRIYQQDLVTGYPCGGPGEPCDAESRPYYRPGSTVSRQQMAKFIDNARRLPGIDIEVEGGTIPIAANNDTGTAITASSTSGQALVATSQNDKAIYAQSGYDSAVYATSLGPNGIGLEGVGNIGAFALSTDGVGVYGTAKGNGHGVVGQSNMGYGVYGITVGDGLAGYFAGDVTITGTCTGCMGPNRIDHPLDPANKYLYHSTVQSPDMMNVYNGNVTTDDQGEAAVQMPGYFEALNRDFRYQLTVVGQFAQAVVWQEIKDGVFVIKTDKPNVKVSWQVTGIRQDAYANAHRAPVEEAKPADEQGTYVHPTELGYPESSGVDYEEQQEVLELGNR